MNKVGFIVKVKARGKEYFYLRVSERFKDVEPKKRDRNIFRFGTRENAIENIDVWIKNIDLFPLELKEMGYDLDDLKFWKEQILSK